MYDKIKDQAKRENKSLAEIIRSSVEEKIFGEKMKAKENGAKFLLRMAKRAEKLHKKFKFSGPKDGSVKHDEYIYQSHAR